MATIANLAVSLTARIGNFEKGFNKAKKITMRFGSDLAKHTKTIAKYGAALVTAAVSALAYFTKQEFVAIDVTNKLSRAIGATVNGIGVLQMAAEEAGMEGLEGSLTRMNRRLGAAEFGAGAAAVTVKKLGLDLKYISSLDVDKKLAYVAQRIQETGVSSEEAARHMQNLGFEQATAVEFLMNGAKNAERYRKEMDKFGLSLSQVDAQKIEDANVIFETLSRFIKGVATQLSVQLAPFISHAAERLMEMGTAGEGMGEKVTNAFNHVLKAMAKLADFFELLKAGWYSFVAVVSGAAATLIQPARAVIKAWQPVLDFFGLGGSNLEQFVDDLSKGFADQTVDAANKASEAMENFNSKINSKNAEIFFERVKSKAEEVAASTANIGKEIQDVVDSAGGKAGNFRLDDLKRVVVGGVSANPGDKGVNRKQGDTMIQRLAEIARNTASPGMLIT